MRPVCTRRGNTRPRPVTANQAVDTPVLKLILPGLSMKARLPGWPLRALLCWPRRALSYGLDRSLFFLPCASSRCLFFSACLCVPAPPVVSRPACTSCTVPRYCVAAGHRSYSDDRASASQSVMPPDMAVNARRRAARFERGRAKTVAGVRLAGHGQIYGARNVASATTSLAAALSPHGAGPRAARREFVRGVGLERGGGDHYVGYRTKTKVSQL